MTERRYASESRRDRRYTSKSTVFAIAALFFLVATFLGVRSVALWLSPPIVEVADVRGKSLEEAEAALRRQGLRPVVDGQVRHEDVPENHIVSQEPDAGRRVKQGRQIRLMVSTGAELATVPFLEGKHIRASEVLLIGAGLEPVLEFKYDKDVPEDYVISQNPPDGSSVRKGTKVALVVSKGPSTPPFAMPDLTGENLGMVRQRLEAMGLTAKIIMEEQTTAPGGTVLRHTPGPGAMVQVNDQITLFVASSPDARQTKLLFVVPDDGPKKVQVKLAVEDALGERTVFEAEYAAGSVIQYQLEWRGTRGTARWFVQGVLRQEVNLR